MKKTIAFFLSFFLLFSLSGCSSGAEEKAEPKEPVAETAEPAPETEEPAAETDDPAKGSILYNLKINPEFEIAANEELIVVNVTAKNADAEKMLPSVNVEGLDVIMAFNTLTEEAAAQGFLTKEKGNTVTITILEKDDESLPTCHLCNGCGTVECLECHGTGILDTCVLCNGQGYFHCDVCNDTGYVPRESVHCDQCNDTGYTTKPAQGCWACNGSGVCYFCGGAGYVLVTAGDTGNVVYNADGTPETEVCVFCKGAKYCVNCMNIPCNRCNRDGNGMVECTAHNTDFELGSECPDCHGTGIIYCGDSFNGYNWCPCCWGSGIEGTGDPNYREYYPDPTE